MAVLDSIEIPAGETPLNSPENRRSRGCFSTMSNSELLRFGLSAKFRSSQRPTPDEPQPEDLAAQLNEARFEWNRRHPDLPLRDSF
jgi:hypothetical protein